MMSSKTIAVLLALSLLGFVGCKKSAKTTMVNTEFNGVQIDWPKLSTEFNDSEPDLSSAADLAVRYIRYSEFPQAMEQLNKLSQNPKLTEAQKKVVDTIIEQTKQVITKAPRPSGQ